mgnify:FL=1
MTYYINCELTVTNTDVEEVAYMDMYVHEFFSMFVDKYGLVPQACRRLTDIPDWPTLPVWAKKDWQSLIQVLLADSDCSEFEEYFSEVEQQDDSSGSESEPDDDDDDDLTFRMNVGKHLYTYYFTPSQLYNIMGDGEDEGEDDVMFTECVEDAY